MIRELNPGRWLAQVYVGKDANGKRIRISRTIHGTKADARRAEAVLLLKAHDHEPERTASLPLQAWLDRWLENVEPHIERATFVGYEQKIRLYLAPELGDVPLDRLTRDRINEAYRSLAARQTRRGAPLSPQTIHHCHRVLHACLEWVLDAEPAPIARNPAARARPPKIDATPPRAPSDEQVVELLRAAAAATDDPILYPFVALAVSTGARRGSLCALRWADLDLDAGQIVIRRSLTDAGGPVVEKSTKTGTVGAKALGPVTVDILRRWRTRQKALALELGAKLEPDAFVFSYDGTRPTAPGAMSKRFGRFAKSAGVPVRLHDLRHFSATVGVHAGVSVREVAERHDHASARMTLERYAGARPAGDQALAALTDAVLLAALNDH